MARPSKYSKALVDKFCNRVANGESVRQICKDSAMPTKSCIFIWLGSKRHPEFVDQYREAQKQGFEVMADELLDTASDEGLDTQRAKLKVDTMKWILSKRLPKTYGDKVSQEISGPDGGAIDTSITIEFVKPVKKED